MNMENSPSKSFSILQERQSEYAVLQQVQHRTRDSSSTTGGKAEVVIITAPSGMGQSNFVEESAGKIFSDNPSGLFISGKCNEIQCNQPFVSIVDAMTLLCDKIIKQGKLQQHSIKEHFLNEVGNDGSILTDLVPKAREIIGYQNPTMEIADSKARKTRLHRVFGCFIHSVTLCAPVILYISDMQWIDEATLDLIQALLTDEELKRLMFICSYIDNDGNEIKKRILDGYFRKFNVDKNVPVTRIEMKPLSLRGVMSIVADHLGMSPDETMPLAKIIYDQTKGNELFAMRLLRYLQEHKLIEVSSNSSQWVWDKVLSELTSIPTSIEDVLADELVQLPAENRDILTRAASIGYYFDDYALKNVAINCRVSDSLDNIPSFQLQGALKTSLDLSISSGLLNKVGNLGYHFYHDKLWRIAYEAIPEDSRDRLHLQNGRVLLKKVQTFSTITSSKNNSRKFAGLSKDDMDNFVGRQIFLMVDQLNKGKRFIDCEVECIDLISLNLRAATFAMKSSAMKEAMSYLNVGIGMLPVNHWFDHYDLSLQLYNRRIEIEHFLGNFDCAETIAMEVLDYAKSLEDMFTAHYFIMQCGAEGGTRNYAAGVECGIGILKQYGWTIPLKPTKNDLLCESIKLSVALRSRPLVSFLGSLPEIDDDSIYNLVNHLVRYCSFSNNEALVILITQRTIRFAIKRGVSKFIPGIIGFWATSLVKQRNFKTAYAYGCLAAQLSDRFKEKSNSHAVDNLLLQSAVLPILESFRDGMDALLESHKVLIRYGNNDPAYGATMGYFISYFAMGLPLDSLLRSKLLHFEKMTKNFPTFCIIFQSYRQFVLNLQVNSLNSTVLKGDAFDEEKTLSSLEGNALKMTLRDTSVLRLQLAFIFWDEECMKEMLDKLATYPSSDFVVGRLHLRLCFVGLAALALREKMSNSLYTKLGQVSMDHFRTLSKLGSVNARAVHFLLMAVAKPGKLAYDKAISGCKEAKFINLEAIACERCAVFLEKKGKKELAQYYILQALTLYDDWGAFAKVQQLKLCYNFLKNITTRDHESSSISFKNVTGKDHELSSNKKNENLDNTESESFASSFF